MTGLPTDTPAPNEYVPTPEDLIATPIPEELLPKVDANGRRSVPCPQCGVYWQVAVKNMSEGDIGVCGHCGTGMVFMANGMPRLPSYDEAVEIDATASAQAIRKIWSRDLPGPGPNGEQIDTPAAPTPPVIS